MVWLLQKLIRLYQLFLSPMLGNQCRFYPTCSCYAHEALAKHGFWKGSFLMIRRILRCQPLTKSGFLDPVPDRFAPIRFAPIRFAWSNVFRYNKPQQPNTKTMTKKEE